MLGIVMAVFASGAWADLRMEILDLSKRAVRLTYELADSQAGGKNFYFPQGGFIHDATAGEFKVESVWDVSNNMQLDYEIFTDKETNLPVLQIPYKIPIPQGAKKNLRITVKVNLPQKFLSVDAAGRNVIICETSHAFEFVIPKDQYIVASNQPITLKEEDRLVIANQAKEEFRAIVIQTRAMKK